MGLQKKNPSVHMTFIQRRINVDATSWIPACTWRLYNVVLTSMQRHDVASTLIRRCINVMCTLGWKYRIQFMNRIVIFNTTNWNPEQLSWGRTFPIRVHCAQRRLKSACASAQSDQSSQGCRYSQGFKPSSDLQWRLWSDYADARTGLSLRWAYMQT